MSTKHGSLSPQAKRWKAQIEQGTLHALARKPNFGRPTSLTPEQFDLLKQIIQDGAVAFGFQNECWTARRIARVIFERFHVRYNFKYVPQLLHRLGLSYQKPDTQSPKRSQKAIDHWRRYVWSRVKKVPRQRFPADYRG